MARWVPSDYAWVERDSAFAEAGCITVVTGLDRDRALTAIGAEASRDELELDPLAVDGPAAIAAVTLPSEPTAVVLVEDNGFEGSRPEVLALLSKKGLAASAYWSVNADVRFGCARRGKQVYNVELPAFDTDEAPRVLKRLIKAADAHDADLVAIAVTMVSTYTGIDVPERDEIKRPARFYPIASPVLGLGVTPDELVSIKLPTPEIVAAAQSAGPVACWRLARYAAHDAVDRAALNGDATVDAVLMSLDSGDGPATLPRTFGDLRAQTLQALRTAGDAYPDDLSTVDEEQGRQLAAAQQLAARRYWAVDALVYTALDDPIAAALGAAYSASIPYGLDSEAAAEFHQRAQDVLG